jgi:hypothetical protein
LRASPNTVSTAYACWCGDWQSLKFVSLLPTAGALVAMLRFTIGMIPTPWQPPPRWVLALYARAA